MAWYTRITDSYFSRSQLTTVRAYDIRPNVVYEISEKDSTATNHEKDASISGLVLIWEYNLREC